MTTEQTSGTDLHTRIREALQERIRLAKAAISESGRWSWTHAVGQMCNDPACKGGALLDEAAPGLRTRDGYIGTVLMEVHGYDIREPWQGAAHIAANDPASTIRRAEAGLRTLAIYDQAKAYLDGLSDAAEAFEVERATTAEEVLAAAIRELAAGEGIEQ